jgi:hypothetical protein
MAVFDAAMQPSLTYTYPIEHDGHDVRMRFANNLKAISIKANGKQETLQQIRDEHRDIVADVRAWDVWRRIRPGPI